MYRLIVNKIYNFYTSMKLLCVMFEAEHQRRDNAQRRVY